MKTDSFDDIIQLKADAVKIVFVLMEFQFVECRVPILQRIRKVHLQALRSIVEQRRNKVFVPQLQCPRELFQCTELTCIGPAPEIYH